QHVDPAPPRVLHQQALEVVDLHPLVGDGLADQRPPLLGGEHGRLLRVHRDGHPHGEPVSLPSPAGSRNRKKATRVSPKARASTRRSRPTTSGTSSRLSCSITHVPPGSRSGSAPTSVCAVTSAA